MLNILKLFGRSPFAPLKSHMEKVAACVEKLPPILEAFKQGRQDEVEAIAKEISVLELAAASIKWEIDGHLPSNLFLSLDRASFLEILSLQAQIGIAAEEIAGVLTLKEIDPCSTFSSIFTPFLTKSIETFAVIHLIIIELDDLLEASFGGAEALRVKQMIAQAGMLEREVTLLQREMLKQLFKDEKQLSLGSFYQWQKVIALLQTIADDAELLAERIGRALKIL